MSPDPLARRIEHTLLRAESRAGEVVSLCDQAIEHGFAGVCVHPVYVRACADRLDGTSVGVVTVVGFPLGANVSEVKAREAERALADGASEVDMVAWVGALLDGNDRAVAHDIEAVVRAAGSVPVKVILETGLLDRAGKVRACELAREAGAAYVKTSTGFGPGGATVEDVRLLRSTVGQALGVKASGGIRDAATARALVDAGADRLGTSRGVAIVRQAGETGAIEERGQ